MAFLCEANQPVSNKTHGFRIGDERLASVAEWETDTSTAGEQTAHFHERNQCSQSTSAGKLKVKRFMIVSLVEHFRPGTGVETTAVAMQRNNMIPTEVTQRIDNPHLQRSADSLRLHERMVA